MAGAEIVDGSVAGFVEQLTTSRTFLVSYRRAPRLPLPLPLHTLVSLAAPLLVACGAERTALDPITLSVAPTAIACVAGDQVTLTATVTGGPATTAFTALGGAVWIASADRTRGVAAVACEAAGSGRVSVDAGGTQLVVPASVQPPPAGTLHVSVSPSTLSLVSGTTAALTAQVTSTRPGVTTDARFTTPDTSVAFVDSLFGIVRAVAPGTTTVSVQARGDRTVRVAVPVTVTRSSALVTSITAGPSSVLLVVGDSVRIGTAVQLATTAPAGTSRAVTYESSDPAVATVSAAGVVRGTGQGIAIVTAAPVAAPLLRARIFVTVRVPAP